VACYSDQLSAQGRVDALCESGAYGATTAFAGSEPDAYIVVDGKSHATGDEATVTVRPCPSVALFEDHVMQQTANGPESEWPPAAADMSAGLSLR
jgi:hypothetical protein